MAECLGIAETEGWLLVALDDCINPKIGKNIFGCETIFDHAAKANQSQYPWAQNLVAAGLLKQVKGRWACLFSFNNVWMSWILDIPKKQKTRHIDCFLAG